MSGEAVPTPQPAAPEAIIAEALADIWGDVPADRSMPTEAVLAALREAGYTVARLEQVGTGHPGESDGPLDPGWWLSMRKDYPAPRWVPVYRIVDQTSPGLPEPWTVDDEHGVPAATPGRVVGPVEPSPPEANDG